VPESVLNLLIMKSPDLSEWIQRYFQEYLVRQRNVSPATVTESTPRTAMLNVFDGGIADGGWTLFIADTSEGGIGSLDSWSLQVTGNPSTGPTVPDNGDALELLAMGISLLLLSRRHQLMSWARANTWR